MFTATQMLINCYMVGIGVTACYVIAVMIDSDPRPTWGDAPMLAGMALLWPITCVMVIYDAISNRMAGATNRNYRR